jgi:hypothetical protein
MVIPLGVEIIFAMMNVALLALCEASGLIFRHCEVDVGREVQA